MDENGKVRDYRPISMQARKLMGILEKEEKRGAAPVVPW